MSEAAPPPAVSVVIKQVILVRKDLNMPKGKIGAQCTHAYRAAVRAANALLVVPLSPEAMPGSSLREEIDAWHAADERTVVLAVHSEQELIDLHQQAQRAGLVSGLAIDNGLTMFNGKKTPTAVAIGPHAASRIDAITQHLKPL